MSRYATRSKIWNKAKDGQVYREQHCYLYTFSGTGCASGCRRNSERLLFATGQCKYDALGLLPRNPSRQARLLKRESGNEAVKKDGESRKGG